jgi:type II secretory pathway pseudopilin PulG
MRVRKHRRRLGAALLEVLIALVILASAGASVAALAIESSRVVQRAHATEDELRRADAFFTVVTLWPREDLDRHLGDREQGPWRLRVERTLPTIYTVSLTDSLGTRVLLRTALYRQEGAP